MKKLTYEEWYCGDITLEYAKSVYNEDSKPKLVSWNDFSDVDVIEIKKKQKEIFQDIVKLKLDKLKVHFEEIYSHSLIKDKLLEMEKQECKTILYSHIPSGNVIFSKNWNVLFDVDDLLEIQNYFRNTILGGNNSNFDFVQSPNDIYQDTSKTLSQAYSLTLFEYLNWLDKNYNVYIDKHEKGIKTEKDFDAKLENPYPLIFVNIQSYNFFMKLKRYLVKNNTTVADFAFIFHKMKNDGYILKDTKHKTFIDFLNNNYNTEIVEVKFPFKNQQTHLKFYNEALKEYPKLI